MFLRGPAHQEDSIKREIGYKSALQANGIPFDENLVLNGDFERDIAYQAIDHFLGNGRQVAFDAIFTGDDDAAIGVLRALRVHGLRIPEDVSVIGFDDQGFAPFLIPPLTTVRAPTERVGQIATEQLFGLLENHPMNEAFILQTEIVFRRSCGCESPF
jgi:DNA-binding LacI/PurR family transcriptional regulator